MLASQPLYRQWRLSQETIFNSDTVVLSKMIGQLTKSNSDTLNIHVPVLQAFDPNLATPKQLADLGFTNQLTKRIAGYRSKGGVFRVKADLMKIYGMDSSLYQRVYGYIDLPETLPVKTLKTTSRSENGFSKVERHKPTVFDLNLADSTELMKIYGIGPSLSKRILKFREALGGYVSHQQLYEVYGLDTAVVKLIIDRTHIAADYVPRKININTADEKALAGHPYIRRAVAKQIIAYRFQHGPFQNISDIRNIVQIPLPQAEKLIPYLTTTD